MAGEHGTFQGNEAQRDETPSHVWPQPRSPLSLGQSSEIEVLLRLAESNAPMEPSLERWAQFNESIMDRAVKSLQRRPTFRERRRIFLDRFRASDSRLKKRMWVVVAAVLLAVALVLVYLVL